jgi:hypothetical protein
MAAGNFPGQPRGVANPIGVTPPTPRGRRPLKTEPGKVPAATGGNLYLAHTIARVRRWRRGLVVVWLVVLASTGGLVVPLIAAGIGGRTLPQVLDRHLLAWAWSLLAALAHEVTAAGCMLSAAALASTAAVAAQERSQSVAVEMLSQRDAARRELEDVLEERSRSQRLPAPLLASAAGTAEPAAAAGSTAAAAPAAELVACREGCGKEFASMLAEMGHLRHCPVRLERQRRRATEEP